MTNYLTYTDRLDAILQMCKYENTGNAKKLASKFCVCERTIKRMIDTLRCQGHKIKYSKIKQSYIFLDK